MSKLQEFATKIGAEVIDGERLSCDGWEISCSLTGKIIIEKDSYRQTIGTLADNMELLAHTFLFMQIIWRSDPVDSADPIMWA